MNQKKKYYLTRLGRSYEVDEHNPILEKWKPKKRDDENVLTLKVFSKDFYVSSYNPAPRGYKYLTTEQREESEKKKKKRGLIANLSHSSVKRLRFLLRNTIEKMEYEVGLTYPDKFSNDGQVVKRHFHKLRMRLNYYGYSHIWILEFQGRGAPHFHMLLNKEIKEETLAKMWFKIVDSGDSKHLKHGVHVAPIKSKDGMSKYFIKYLSKQDQKHVPQSFRNVGRFWGASRSLLECTVKKYYGNPEDIQFLKKQMRPLRRWYEGQKRSWTKKRILKGAKVYKNKFIRRGVTFKVIHSDLFVNELRKRNTDTSLYDMGQDFGERFSPPVGNPPKKRGCPSGGGKPSLTL